MTKVVALMSMSLDGYVADANDGVAEVFDWYFSGDDESGHIPRVLATPALGALERAPTGEHGADLSGQAPQVVGARRRDAERHPGSPARCGDLDLAREVPVENLGDPVVRVSDVPVERHRHECDHLGHAAAPSTDTSVLVVSFMASSFLSCGLSRYDRTAARLSSVAALPAFGGRAAPRGSCSGRISPCSGHTRSGDRQTTGNSSAGLDPASRLRASSPAHWRIREVRRVGEAAACDGSANLRCAEQASVVPLDRARVRE